MIESYQNKRALLLGNGINLLDKEQSFSWGALLDDLKREYNIQVDLDNIFKPFPLAFEEMLHRKEGSSSFENMIRVLKSRIRKSIENQLLNKRGFNDYHKRIALKGYDDILTTNYDYSIQKSMSSRFSDGKDRFALNKQEQRFSLKRKYQIPDSSTIIWHIHGELIDSRSIIKGTKNYHEESIMIGYEHYASYLHKIQENFKGKSGQQKLESQSLMTRIKNGVTGTFWTDIFFTHNIDIVGLGFDFSENHLWWLINQRANIIRSNNEKYEVVVNNRIRFYFPEINGTEVEEFKQPKDLEKAIKKKSDIYKAKAISEVLEAFKVEPCPIRCNSYNEFYDNLLDHHLVPNGLH